MRRSEYAMAIKENAIHALCVSLDVIDPYLHFLYSIISQDERERADRLIIAHRRRNFIASRGLLRIILSRYLICNPSQIRFCYNYYGKPYIVPIANREELSFNVSHSNSAVLYGLARGRTIGVDIEFVRRDINYEGIASAIFSEAEIRNLHSLPISLRPSGFYIAWTRREAYAKAIGTGMMSSNSSSESELDKEIAFSREGMRNVPKWSLHDISPMPGYVGALVVEGESQLVCCRQWHPEQLLNL